MELRERYVSTALVVITATLPYRHTATRAMSETVSEAVSAPAPAAGPSPMFRSKRRVLLMKFVVLLISAFFSLALIELALRIISPASLFGSGLPLRPHNRMI